MRGVTPVEAVYIGSSIFDTGPPAKGVLNPSQTLQIKIPSIGLFEGGQKQRQQKKKL